MFAFLAGFGVFGWFGLLAVGVCCVLDGLGFGRLFGFTRVLTVFVSCLLLGCLFA